MAERFNVISGRDPARQSPAAGQGPGLAPPGSAAAATLAASGGREPRGKAHATTAAAAATVGGAPRAVRNSQSLITYRARFLVRRGSRSRIVHFVQALPTLLVAIPEFAPTLQGRAHSPARGAHDCDLLQEDARVWAMRRTRGPGSMLSTITAWFRVAQSSLVVAAALRWLVSGVALGGSPWSMRLAAPITDSEGPVAMLVEAAARAYVAVARSAHPPEERLERAFDASSVPLLQVCLAATLPSVT